MEKEFDRKDDGKRVACEGADYDLGHGDSIVIAAITSCTNTSNPYVMLGAGLVARNAVEKFGLKAKAVGQDPRWRRARRSSPNISRPRAC